ncbi:uncharacterized protein [Primulina huaijiensis]|uniref:uncharacterized protein n=1 Tax=Primulina huaijiensis TaxID=1492673 RepID=UPI003CC77FA2
MAKAFLIKYFPPSKTMKLPANITTFAQFEQESLYKAWEPFKDLLRRCPHHELPLGLVVQTFYYGLLTPNRTMIDVAACGNQLRKTAEEGYELLEEMVASSYHPQSERNNQRRNATVHQVTDLSAITAQLDVLNRKLDGLNMGGTAMRLQEIFCDKCRGEHFAKDCQDENPFYVQEGAPVNQVGVQNRPRNDPYSNTYNPGGRQHFNFSWGGQNIQNRPPGGQPYGKQPMYRSDPPREEKSNLEQMMSKFISSTETRLQNQDTLIKGLQNQIGQLAKMIASREPGTLPSNTETNPKEQVKAIELKSGKILESREKEKSQVPDEQTDTSKGKSSNSTPGPIAQSKIVIPPPFPAALKKEKLDAQFYFMVLDMEEDMEMPLILRRPFLATGKALIDVQEGKLRLRDIIKDPLEAILTTELKEEKLDAEKTEILAYLNANHPWKRPMKMTLEDLGDRRDLILQKCDGGQTAESLERAQEFICMEGGGYHNPSVCMHKILMEDKYSPLVQPQRRLNPKMQEVVKVETIKLLDSCIIYPISDSAWNLKVVLMRCEEKNLVLNWEKCHFMVQEGIVLGHKISEHGIEVDKAKVEVIKNLPPPTSIKGAYEDLNERLVTAPVLV